MNAVKSLAVEATIFELVVLRAGLQCFGCCSCFPRSWMLWRSHMLSLLEKVKIRDVTSWW